ncbi:MAG: helix-turn-helix domain-containing protein [Candidatus Woesearchaeota archaeon]
MKEKLIEIGLSNHEAEVYLYLLKSDRTTATKIAKDLKINRTVIYSVVDKLIEKGMANFILIDGKRHFSTTNPKFLQDYLTDKQNTLSEIMPILESVKKNKNETFSCEVYEGLKGGIAVMKDILRYGKDYVSFGDEGQLESVSGTVLEQYLRQLDEKDIKERILSKKGVSFKLARKKTEIRFLSKEFSFPTSTTIYGDKVAIAIFEGQYHIILIHSESLAKTYKSMFEVLWKTAKKQ